MIDSCTAYVNHGTVNLYPDITGEFWSLVPGENELRFSVSSGADLNTLLEVSFRDAYGGI